jgi:hypothetical protein
LSCDVFIRGAHGKQIEPFIITDAIYLLSNAFKVPIKQYKVKQTALERFVFYMESTYAQDKAFVVQCQSLLKELLESVLGYEIIVTIDDIERDESIYSGNKYKYFETSIPMTSASET